MTATKADQSKTPGISPYPLPESLTRRILGYLGIYRLVIALLLFAGRFLTLPNESL